MAGRHSKAAKVEEAGLKAQSYRSRYEANKEELGPEARNLLEQYEGAGQLTPDGGYGITRDELHTGSREFGEREQYFLHCGQNNLDSEREAQEELQEALELPDAPSPEEGRGRMRAAAEKLARKAGLDAEQTEALIAAYPDWEERQPPEPDSDDWYEWWEDYESGPQARSLSIIENVPVGAVLSPYDPELVKEGSAVAVPDYGTGHIRFIPVERMTEADWNAVMVGVLGQPTEAETWAWLGRWLERKIELDPNLGAGATIGEAARSEVQETSESPASLSEARRWKED